MDGCFGAFMEFKYCSIIKFEILFAVVKSAYSSFILSGRNMFFNVFNFIARDPIRETNLNKAIHYE